MPKYPKLWLELEDDNGKSTTIDIPNPVFPPVDSDVKTFGSEYGAASGLGDFINYGIVGDATIVAAE